jgi:hypothetical protein
MLVDKLCRITNNILMFFYPACIIYKTNNATTRESIEEKRKKI